jgi:hypothetical protein
MKPRTLYLAPGLAGVLVPYWQFLPWVVQHGLNLTVFARELFATRIGAFWEWMLLSPPWLLVFSRIEGARIGIRRRWLVVVAVLTVGVPLGLPLFLNYMRELELERKTGHSRVAFPIAVRG